MRRKPRLRQLYNFTRVLTVGLEIAWGRDSVSRISLFSMLVTVTRQVYERGGKHYITSAKTRLQSPVLSVKTWVCVWVFNRAGSKIRFQLMLLSAIGTRHLTKAVDIPASFPNSSLWTREIMENIAISTSCKNTSPNGKRINSQPQKT